jgi:hypothetical protein
MKQFGSVCFCAIFPLRPVCSYLVRLTKICLNEAYNKIRIRKHLPDTFKIQDVLEQKVLSPLLFNFALKYTIRKAKGIQNRLGLNGT